MKEGFMSRIKSELSNTFDEVYGWFDVQNEVMYSVGRDGGWSIAEVLEHISLTNYYLLILIRKGAIKSLEMAAQESYRHLLEGYDIDWAKMELIGKPGAFKWHRPAHMVPTGSVSLEDVKNRLRLQEKECLDLLEQLAEGQGVLYKTTMSVNNLGKLDVYHYMVFLVEHTRRHLVQMKQIAMI